MDQRQTGSDSSEPTHGTGGKLGQVAGRSDGGKSIMHTIHPLFMVHIGEVSRFGAQKYHMRNFLMAPGMQWSRVYESLLRHLFAYWAGEELDVGPNGEYGPYPDNPEIDMKWSGLPHLWMASWNMMVLHHYHTAPVYHAGDDRPSKIEHRGHRWQNWDELFKYHQTAKANRAAPETKEARDPEFLKADARDWFTRPANSKPEPWEKRDTEFTIKNSITRTAGIANFCIERGGKDVSLHVDDLVNLLKAASGKGQTENGK